MNFSSILAHIEKLDPEVYERTSERRSVIKNFMRGVSLTALPFAIGSLFNKAYGGTNAADPIVEALQFALKLEWTEREFYRYAIEQTETHPPQAQLIPTVTGLELPAIKMIWRHEQQHFDFVKGMIEGLGQQMTDMPKLDFSGGKGTFVGPFTQVFQNYGTFLALAQAFEDLGVRAYKGQMTTLKPNNDYLRAAMRIHSIEARHAAHIRIMRSQTPGPLTDGQDIKPWITMKATGVNGLDVQPFYLGEENTIHVNTEVTNIAGFQIPDFTASEAFDEPMSMTDVLNVLDPFFF